jgi:hypothetical protein
LTILAFVAGVVFGTGGFLYYFFGTFRIYPALPPPIEVSECSANLVRLGTALEAFRGENGRYPTSQYELVPRYLGKLPECPSARRVTYRTSFGPELVEGPLKPDDYFMVECCGDNHDKWLVAPYSPSFDSIDGLKVEFQP